MKYILIGKCEGNESGGPGNIIQNMLQEFQKMDIELEAVLLNKECKKWNFVIKIIKKLIYSKNCFVNVHTDGFLIPMLVLILSYFNHKNIYYLTIHGVYYTEHRIIKNENSFYIWIETILYKNFPNLICVSEMLKEDIKKIYGRTKQVFVIPNATDAYSSQKYLKKSQDMKIEIIMVGGLRKRKGIEEALELVAYLVNKKKLPLHFSICGLQDENYNKKWLALEKQRLKIEEIVEYLGNISDKQELYNRIATADFQLCLSKYDTFNVAIAESLVLGCPCICTNKCGASCLIEQGENGLVVDMSSDKVYENIYNYILSFLENETKREEIQSKLLDIRKKLSWSGVCKQYINLAEKSIKKNIY